MSETFSPPLLSFPDTINTTTTSSPSPSSSSSSHHPSSISTAAIVGISITLSLAFISSLLILGFILYNHKRRKPPPVSTPPSEFSYAEYQIEAPPSLGRNAFEDAEEKGVLPVKEMRILEGHRIVTRVEHGGDDGFVAYKYGSGGAVKDSGDTFVAESGINLDNGRGRRDSLELGHQVWNFEF